MRHLEVNIKTEHNHQSEQKAKYSAFLLPDNLLLKCYYLGTKLGICEFRDSRSTNSHNDHLLIGIIYIKPAFKILVFVKAPDLIMLKQNGEDSFLLRVFTTNLPSWAKSF